MGKSFISEIKNIDPKLTPSSWGASWEVRSKLITCVLICFGIITLQTPQIILTSFILFFVLTISMGFRFIFIISKLILLVPFLLFMTVPILFANGLAIDQERINFVINLNGKVLTSALVMMILTLSQPLSKLLQALSHLRIPSSIVAILMLALHFVKIFLQTIASYQKSLRARGFQPSARTNSLKVYSGVMAGLLLRNIDNADKVHLAMTARGFNGTIPTSPIQKFTKTDFIKSASLLVCMMILILIEKWWV
ncbi:energy-coupling factor transporter transmembrane component T family protein [Aliibacillus thermotolerans]|uniref:Energy-coupling factor transporter transmembrane component T family protein n=1 Tax=Aliibacillus thermotolerans TaxID=1834418 RepID=A0ABW0U8V7_9BACI|nr:energy-coupling factor transporter transmembrane component T [Aliibacillus thermotolerans]MDA3130313.1 hypothetical protein [Aliibacillus thermotolerans]